MCGNYLEKLVELYFVWKIVGFYIVFRNLVFVNRKRYVI